MNEFEKLGLKSEIAKSLAEMNITSPTEIQGRAIPLAIKGKDIIGGSATGSGKTLAFSAPIIQNLKHEDYVQSLILTPTRELAEQVATSIKKYAPKSLKVLPVYGGVDIEKQIRELYNTDVVVGTPGRIIDHLKRRTLSLDKIKILILDECDRMFDMGFYQDVEFIIAQCPKKRQTMLFSATVSADIDHFAKKHTSNAKIISVESNVDPTKLKQVYYDVPDHLKFSLLVQLLKREKSKLVMVFCNTRRNVDFVVQNLGKQKIDATAIHGGLDQKKRSRIMENFHKKNINVLVCTDVAARGLDIKGVTHVYNYDLPKDPKEYVHRIGRTARAGKEGQAINILASRDYDNFRKIMAKFSKNISQEKAPYIQQVELDTTGFGRRRSRDSGRGSNSGRPIRRSSSRAPSGSRERSPRGGSRSPARHSSNRSSRNGRNRPIRRR